MLRPRSATAIPMKPIVRATGSSSSEPELPAERCRGAGEAGETPGDRHREEVVPRDADAAVPRRLGVEADGAHLVSERRPVQDDRVDDERAERDEQAEWRPCRTGSPQKTGSLRRLDDVVRGRDVPRSVFWSGPPNPKRYVPDPDDDPVEHDRRDHLVRADRGLEDAGDARPDRAGQHRRRRSRGRCERRRAGPASDVPTQTRDDRADAVLALSADVEEAAAEREGDGEPGEHERRRRG